MSSPRRFGDVAEIIASAGETIGTSGWREITQDRIDVFADATGDHQWIHVDVERAASGPFGATIAHGYLSLAMLPLLGAEIYTADLAVTRLNYGINRARFPHPVRVGSRIRAHLSFGEATKVPAGTQLLQRFVIEIEGVDKPACVADTVVLLLG